MSGGEALELLRKRRLFATVTPAPRPWAAMFVAWTSLLDSLCAIVAAHAGVPMIAEASTAAWRWMLSLPPCSEARKAAFTLGSTAFWIERWRLNPDGGADRSGLCFEHFFERFAEDHGASIPSAEKVMRARARAGQITIADRAELGLRVAAWHIGDAKLEASAQTRTPGVPPPHIRFYAHLQPVDPEHGGVNFCGVMKESDRRRVTLAMLDDFVRHASERKTLKQSDDRLIALAPALVETLGASLPEGPWIVTSQDIWLFLAEVLLEDEHSEPRGDNLRAE